MKPAHAGNSTPPSFICSRFMYVRVCVFMHKSTFFELRWALLNALIFILTVSVTLTIALKTNY